MYRVPIRLSELWENRVLLSELWEPCRNYGKIAFLLSELWEPMRRNYWNLFFFVGIVGKSRFSSLLTLLSEFREPPIF
jgi:hypothetical protein